MKILSEGKFRKFDGFQSMGVRQTVVLNFEDTKIECTDDHQFLRDDGKWIEAKDIQVGDTFNGHSFLNRTQGKETVVYDAINVRGTHSFYAEGLTAHNCSLLYIDEAAFVPNWDEFFSSVYPTISSGKTTKLFYTSTPNGLNHYYYICEGAKTKKNGFGYIEVPWHEVPGRDDKWYNETLASMNFDYEKFAVEFECQFLGSSGTLISGSALKQLEDRIPMMAKGDIKKYEDPMQDGKYILIADVSRGKGLDYSAFQVIDITQMPYRQVCTFRSNMITPIEYAEIIFRVAKTYNEAMVLVEINDIGQQVADLLYQDYEYENVIQTENAGAGGKRISTGGKKSEIGVRTTKTVKAIGCSTLKLLIEQKQLMIVDKQTISELSTFSKKKGSYEAEPGNNDDLVMGLVLFAWLTNQQYFKELTDIHTLKELRDRTNEEIDNEMLPFGFVDTGHDDSSIIDLTENPHMYKEFNF